MTTSDPKPRDRWWSVPGTVGVGNIVIAILVGAVGIRYDERGESPGLVVWVAILMMLPTWLVVLIVQRSGIFGKPPPSQIDASQIDPELLEDLLELQKMAKSRGSTTGVLNTVALPESITESTDDGKRR